MGAVVVVSARNAQALDEFTASHPGSHAIALDVGDRTALANAMPQVLDLRGRIDVALYCAGHYNAMRASEFDLSEALRHLQINYIGALYLLDATLPTLIRQGHGHVSLMASVAGYRGLPLSVAYGPTKAALQHLAETLFLDLRPAGVGVSVINPGFVATPLTAANRFDMPALLTPEQAARDIVRGWARGRFDINFPWRFTVWLRLMRLLPHRWYFTAVRRMTGA